MMQPPLPDQGPRPIPLGRFRHDLPADTWWWSDELFAIYGLDPAADPATLELALCHVHPEEREAVATALSGTLASFAVFHRVVVGEVVKHVLTCGHHSKVEGGSRLSGYMIDLTDRRRQDSRADVEEAIAKVTERRAEIEQAKGCLMTQFGIDSEQAFSVLSAYSQRANLKVRDVARQVVEAATGDALSGPVSRQRLDSLLASIAHRED